MLAVCAVVCSSPRDENPPSAARILTGSARLLKEAPHGEAQFIIRKTADHEEIRRWAEERGGKPACVRGTGGGEDVGMIRLDFPGYSGEDTLQEIDWDEWFQKFDESNLALMVQDETADGQRSNFNKLVGRETAEERAQGVRTSRPARKTEARSNQRSGSRTSARASGPSSRSQSSSRSGRSQGSRSRGSSRSSASSRTTGSARTQSSRRKSARSSTRTTGRSSGSKGSGRAA
jgi:hypothetical protein